jgi:hypothetical protein
MIISKVNFSQAKLDRFAAQNIFFFIYPTEPISTPTGAATVGLENGGSGNGIPGRGGAAGSLETTTRAGAPVGPGLGLEPGLDLEART